MRKTQKERVIDYIKKFGSITSYEAFRDLGITRLSARVYELKEDGYKFKSKTEFKKNRFGDQVYYARYELAKKRRASK